MSDKRLLTGLAAFLLVNLLFVIFLRDTVATVAGSYSDIPASTIWFSMQHAWALYVLTPLVITSAIIILLAPGVLVVMAGKWAANPGELLLKGFGISFLLHFMNSALAGIFSDGALNPSLFITLLSTTLACAFGYLVLRAQQTSGIFGILSDHNNHGLYYTLLAIPFIFIVPLLPVFFWQDLNADGFEAMEIGRSLSFSLLPMAPEPSGTMGLGNGMVPMAYPIHWFIMLFGPIEVSTRLPLILYTMVVFASLASCIEYQSPRRMRWYEQAGLLLGIACYVVATVFNSGYDNYFSDISSPAAFDTLTILLIIGSVYFLWTGMSRWFLFFTVLGFLARPTILLIVVLMGAAIWIAAPDRRRSSLVLIGTTIGIWAALLIGYEHLLLPSISDGHGTPYSSASIITRYKYLTFTDLHRFLYAAAPTGILPVLALLAYRWQDSFSRCISIVTAGYFLAFYTPAFVSLHHFVPVMILPLIVLWRLILSRTNNVRPTLVTAGVTAAMLWLSLPQHFEINRIFRDIGSRTAYLIGDYQGDFSAYRQSMQGTSLIDSFFPYDWNVKDPARELAGGYQLIYYANTSGQPAANTNYLMLPAGSGPPDGYTLLKSDARGSAWVRDRNLWDADRYHPATTKYRSRIYEISRETSFYFTGIPAHNYDIDLGSIPLLWRIFPG